MTTKLITSFALASATLLGSSSTPAVVKHPAIAMSIRDEPLDGFGDTFSSNSQLVSQGPSAEVRAIQEFDVRDLAGLTIFSATIEGRVSVSNSQSVGPRTFDFLVFPGNGFLDLNDFEIPAVVVGSASYAPPAVSSFDFDIDVTAELQDLVYSGATHLGLKVDCTSSPNPSNLLRSTTTLTVVASETVCGDGLPEGTEPCDDGNGAFGDGCTPDCQVEGICPDGVVNPGEQCDDGNSIATDGCEPDCSHSSIDVGHIYLGVSAVGGGSGVYVVDADGANMHQIAGGSYAGAIEVDPANGKVYWMNGDGIHRANLDGSAATFVVPVDNGRDLEIDLGGKLYWVDVSNEGSIFRANHDGTNVEPLRVATGEPTAIALAGGKLYWLESEPDLIRRANLDGSSVQTIAQTSESSDWSDILEIDPVSSKMYWSQEDGFHRANLDGTNVELVDILPTAFAIAPGFQVYWTLNLNLDEFSLHQLHRAPPTGSPDHIVMEADGFLGGIALLDASVHVPGPPPGRIPPDLQVAKSTVVPGQLVLSWPASCSDEAVDYAIYEGSLGQFDGHHQLDCTDDGFDGIEAIAPSAGDRYYLVVPLGLDEEGSYGVDSKGAERPPADAACRESQHVSACPF